MRYGFEALEQTGFCHFDFKQIRIINIFLTRILSRATRCMGMVDDLNEMQVRIKLRGHLHGDIHCLVGVT